MNLGTTIAAAAFATASLVTASVLPAKAGTEAYIGEIMLVGFDFCPRGSAEAAGQLLPINSNTALFSLFGAKYGGDGRNTFALPDLRGKAPIEGARFCVAIEGVYPSRS